jgi:hypothetical protein
VLRGASWYSVDASWARSVYRNGDDPADWNTIVGFRCARGARPWILSILCAYPSRRCSATYDGANRLAVALSRVGATRRGFIARGAPVLSSDAPRAGVRCCTAIGPSPDTTAVACTGDRIERGWSLHAPRDARSPRAGGRSHGPRSLDRWVTEVPRAPKPDVVVPVRRIVPVPIRAARPRGFVVVLRSTAKHAEIARGTAETLTLRRCRHGRLHGARAS